MISKMKKRDYVFVVALSIIPLIQFAIMWVAVNVNSLILPFQKYNLTDNRFEFLPINELFFWFKDFFADLSGDYMMQATMRNSIFLYLFNTLIMFPMHVLVAYAVWKKLCFSNFFTIMLYLPNIISGIVFSIVFKYFVEYGFPIIANNPQLQSMITNPDTGFNTLLIYSSWLGFGGGLVLYLGAMSRIPGSVIEYGQLEGIGAIREFWNVVVPMIFPTISVFIITGFVSIFTSQFCLVPFFGVSAPSNMQTFGYYFFVMVIGNNSGYAMYPYAATASLIFTLILTPIVLIVRWALEKYGPNPEY